MAMSTRVAGFKPPDDKWKSMKAVWDSCRDAGVDAPREVEDFFEEGEPDSQGVEVNIEDHECCSEYSEDSAMGFEIDVTKLPKDVTVIRFVNSW